MISRSLSTVGAFLIYVLLIVILFVGFTYLALGLDWLFSNWPLWANVCVIAVPATIATVVWIEKRCR